jgi:hypothetical protein
MVVKVSVAEIKVKGRLQAKDKDWSKTFTYGEIRIWSRGIVNVEWYSCSDLRDDVDLQDGTEVIKETQQNRHARGKNRRLLTVLILTSTL